MRPADSKDERTVAVVTKRGELHLVTTQNITTGMELTYWADSQSSTWTRKNKIDKTSELLFDLLYFAAQRLLPKVEKKRI